MKKYSYVTIQLRLICFKTREKSLRNQLLLQLFYHVVTNSSPSLKNGIYQQVSHTFYYSKKYIFFSQLKDTFQLLKAK